MQPNIPDFFAAQQDYIAQLNAMLAVMRASQPLVGEIRALAHTNPPAGWLACDGGEVSRAEYATLFAAIGTAYGDGDGETTFALPDLTGRVLLGAAPGASGGASSIILDVEQMPSHVHDVEVTLTAASGQQQPFVGAVLGKGGGQANIYVPAASVVLPVALGGVSENHIGEGAAIDITPAYTGVLHCIYAGAWN